MIKNAQKEDLEKILELQYLAYQSEAELFGNCELTSKTSKMKKAELSRENAFKVRKSAVYS